MKGVGAAGGRSVQCLLKKFLGHLHLNTVYNSIPWPTTDQSVWQIRNKWKTCLQKHIQWLSSLWLGLELHLKKTLATWLGLLDNWLKTWLELNWIKDRNPSHFSTFSFYYPTWQHEIPHFTIHSTFIHSLQYQYVLQLQISQQFISKHNKTVLYTWHNWNHACSSLACMDRHFHVHFMTLSDSFPHISLLIRDVLLCYIW